MKSGLSASIRVTEPSPTATGMATSARATPVPGSQGETTTQTTPTNGTQDESHEDERDRPADRDVADQVAVLRRAARGGRHEEGRQPHGDPATDAHADDPDQRAGQSAPADVAQDLAERPGRGSGRGRGPRARADQRRVHRSPRVTVIAISADDT